MALVMLLITACADDGEPADAGDTGGDSEDSDEEAQAEEDGEGFYETEADQIEILVSWSPGGGADTMSRMLAPFLSEHIQGNPDVGIDYVEGGGGLNGHNEFQHRREPDGTTTLMSAASSVVPFLLDEPAIEFDFLDWEPVIAFPTGNVVSVNPNTGVEEPADLQDPDEPLRFGSIGVVSGDVVGLLALDLLDIEYETTFGYEGAGDVRTAFERGEINVTRDGTVAYLNDMQPIVEDGGATSLFTTGYVEEGELVRDPAFPDLPTVKEVYEELHGEEPSGDIWDLYMSIVGPMSVVEKVLWYHGDAPPEAIQAARDATAEFADDEEFREELEGLIGPYDPIVGDEVGPVAEDVFEAVDEDLQSTFRSYLEENHGLEEQ